MVRRNKQISILDCSSGEKDEPYTKEAYTMFVFAARSQAVAGADAAALAAAVATYPAAANDPPTQVAASVAKANGVELVSCICRVDSSLETRVVVVIVGVPVDAPILGRLSIRAGARAEFDPRRWLGR